MFTYTSNLAQVRYLARQAKTVKFARGCLNNIVSRPYVGKGRMEEAKAINQQPPVFKFTDYDCIGFDLDNTICRYKVGPMIQLEYDTLAQFMVEEKKYSKKHLCRPIEENIDFMMKGLFLDVEHGNLLHIGENGKILRGSHGTTELNRQELTGYYGSDCRWHVTDTFAKDPLNTWNGPISEKMRTLLDYFDMPAGLIFARAIDSVDEENGRQSCYNVWPDVLEGLQFMFNRDHFQLNKGGYFPSIKENPSNYIHRCSDSVIKWLMSLHENRVLFLITGSNVDFASHTAENSLGLEWRTLFDIVIFFAKKPGFFTQDRPFLSLQGFQELGPVDTEKLERRGMYTHGNWDGLYKFLKKHSGKDKPKILYIGDNLVQDIYTPAVHTPCDTVAICEELEAEGIGGHKKQHTDEKYLVSSTWGSYFYHGEEQTIWKKILMKHAKLCIPNLEYVALKPIYYEYK